MPGVLLECSCIVTAESHNPTILNRDWLEINGIVQNGWGWDIASAPITTPPLAKVEYDSGVSIILETGRLIVKAVSEDEDSLQRIQEIACNYVNVLPHIPYKAVGNNIKKLVEFDQAKSLILDKLILNGPWKTDSTSSATVKFVYGLDRLNSFKNVGLEAGVYQRIEDDQAEAESREAILFSFNYHRPGEQGSIKESIVSAIECFRNDFDDHFNYIQEVKNGLIGE